MLEQAGVELERLQEVMARLRAEGGCPWDREQDLRSLRPYLLEEAYEVLEEMDRVGYGGPWAPLCEELGDLLFQIVFHAQMGQERGAFSLADVCRAIADKIVRRHPHVFGEQKVDSAAQVLANWAQLKAQERREKNGFEGSALDGVPEAAPALLRAERITEKASRVGFDWPDAAGARRKLTEELGELDDAMGRMDRDQLEHELGDVLLSVVNLSRFLKTPPEDALRQAIHRFTTRFRTIEGALRERGVRFGEATLAQLDGEWEAAKAREALLPAPRVPSSPPTSRVRLAVPEFDASETCRRAVFSHLGWRRERLENGVRYAEAGRAFEFTDTPGATVSALTLTFEAPSREDVRVLFAGLAAIGVVVPEPRGEADGAFAIEFSDPSGTRWRYATR